MYMCVWVQVLCFSLIKCDFLLLLANRGNRLEDRKVILLSAVNKINLIAVHIALLSFLFVLWTGNLNKI